VSELCALGATFPPAVPCPSAIGFAFRRLPGGLPWLARLRLGSGEPKSKIKQSLTLMFHELLPRDLEDGPATAEPSRGNAGLVPRRT